ncbi:hypothetical protein PIB30_069462 [Stylosanthes scabra]|uniref:Uncharacterized protein n=1 Tax=Stylosanthes scabra TaxID=79078 RepID=A0ABU6TPR7_9FABA|nr:hypothetical protein [Stylosanthes scabra]
MASSPPRRVSPEGKAEASEDKIDTASSPSPKAETPPPYDPKGNPLRPIIREYDPQNGHHSLIVNHLLPNTHQKQKHLLLMIKRETPLDQLSGSMTPQNGLRIFPLVLYHS